MPFSWSETIFGILGAAVLLFIVPRFVAYYRMIRLVEYINMDRIRFYQLLSYRRDDMFGLEIALKLREKGFLLAWKSQKQLIALRNDCRRLGAKLEFGAFEALCGSLESYRDSMVLHGNTYEVPTWRPGEEFTGWVPPAVAQALKAIDRDWREFGEWTQFLTSYLKSHVIVELEHS